MILDHNRTILDTKQLNDTEELILCRINNPSGMAYATWKRRIGTAATYYGNYYDNEGMARIGFQERR